MKTKKPVLVPGKSRFLRRKRIVKGARDIERGVPDTERRGMANDLPGAKAKSGRV